MRKLSPLPEYLLERHRKMYARKVAASLGKLRPRSAIERMYLNEIRNFNQGMKGLLLVGEASVLIGLVQRCENILGPSGDSTEISRINKKLHAIFDYDGFIRRKGPKHAPWGGATLMEEITKRVRYCPYCNAETVFAIQIDQAGKTKVKKSAFDHFFPRERYPFLGLALYNLIPACTRCNSSFKHDEWMLLLRLPHPYLDPDVHTTMRFVPVLNSDANFSRPTADSIQRLLVMPRTGGDWQQTSNYQHIFRTEDVYTELFRQEAADVIWKAETMTSSYGTVMTQFVADVGLCRQDFERLVWGTPLTDKDINRHRLSKLTIDLEREFARPRGLSPIRSLSAFT